MCKTIRTLNDIPEIDLNNIDWKFIAVSYKLSEEFIEKHSDKVYWFGIFNTQQLSEEFKNKHWEDYYISK